MADFTAFPIQNINIPALPDVSPVTDSSQFIMERAGTGRVNATAIRDYATLYTAPGAGAVSRTIASRLSDIVSVKDYGAVGDGVTDDLAAINAAIAAVVATGGVVFFPPATYAVSGSIIIRNPDVILQGSGAGQWLFGGRPGKGTTIRYTGAVNHDALLDISPVIPSGDFIWCVNCRDMTLDCNGMVDIGILLSSVCNSEFANLNVLNAQTAGIYICAAQTSTPTYSLRDNLRNINITLGDAAHGLVLDSATGTTPNIAYGTAFIHCENIQVTHKNGNAYILLNCDDNLFLNCGASRASGGTGFGALFNGTSDGSLKSAQNNRFIGAIFAGTPTGTASPIRALAGTSPSTNNSIEFSSMDGMPTVTIDPGASLYWQTIGSYVSGAIPAALQPGVFLRDATYGSIPSPTRLLISGGQNNGNVLLGVVGGTAVGGGALATLPQFAVPCVQCDYAFADLPALNTGSANLGATAFCWNARKPGEAAGAGTGMLVVWTPTGWTTAAGTPVTA